MIKIKQNPALYLWERAYLAEVAYELTRMQDRMRENKEPVHHPFRIEYGYLPQKMAENLN